MSWDRVQGNWDHFQERLQDIWGELTAEDIAGIEGRQEQLIACIQHRYGITREEAESQVSEWLRRV
jgi:uncharacterized protein YjbJ (UPF0337 family)